MAAHSEVDQLTQSGLAASIVEGQPAEVALLRAVLTRLVPAN